MGSPCPPKTSVGAKLRTRARLTRYSASDLNRREGSIGSGEMTGFGVIRFRTQSPASTDSGGPPAHKKNRTEPGRVTGRVNHPQRTRVEFQLIAIVQLGAMIVIQ